MQILYYSSIILFIVQQERSPPVIDDFLYVCDDAYKRDELLEIEKRVLKAVDFDIGIPLSYTFLRRYAQVCIVIILTCNGTTQNWLVSKSVSVATYPCSVFMKTYCIPV